MPSIVIMPLGVIPAKAGIQLFRAFLDARFRGLDRLITKKFEIGPMSEKFFD
jgi:hypothetical protein